MRLESDLSLHVYPVIVGKSTGRKRQGVCPALSWWNHNTGTDAEDPGDSTPHFVAIFYKFGRFMC